MKFATTVLVCLISFNVFAFSDVTHVLPSGKILICKDANQVRNGEVVENYRRSSDSTRRDQSRQKASEFKLPTIGQTIKISRIKLKEGNRFKSDFEVIEVGQAKIVEASLVGEMRTTVTYPFRAPHIEEKTVITKAEADEIVKECIVAVPSGEGAVKSGDIVKF